MDALMFSFCLVSKSVFKHKTRNFCSLVLRSEVIIFHLFVSHFSYACYV